MFNSVKKVSYCRVLCTRILNTLFLGTKYIEPPSGLLYPGALIVPPMYNNPDGGLVR